MAARKTGRKGAALAILLIFGGTVYYGLERVPVSEKEIMLVKPTIILMPGLGGTNTIWENQLKALGAEGYPLAPIELARDGQGRPMYSVEAMADHVMEHVRRLSGPVIIGGISMGGAVTMQVAARMLADPALAPRLKGVIVSNARGHAQNIPTPPLSELRKEFNGIHGSAQSTNGVTPEETMAHRIACNKNPDPEPALRVIARSGVPVLVIGGKKDPVMPLKQNHDRIVDIIQRNGGNLKAVIVDSWHLSPLESAAEVTALIKEFGEGIAKGLRKKPEGPKP